MFRKRSLFQLISFQAGQLFFHIIDDLISLLTKKGFESFKDLNVHFDVDIEQEQFYSFGAMESLNSDFETDSTIKGANTL